MAWHGLKRTVGKALRTGLLRLRPGPKPLELSPLPPPDIPLGDRTGGFAGDWNRVPGTNCRWPMVHHGYISYKNACGDLRSLWEASRFRWARPEDFPNAFKSWIQHNPVGLGPNWASSLEVAIRVVNWVFLHNAVFRKMSSRDNQLVLGWIMAHARHLLNNPETSPPNHALGRALGLFIAGGYLGDRNTAGVGLRDFISAFNAQFLADGSHSEGAVGYGFFALEMALVFVAAARAWGFDPGPVDQALSKCLEAGSWLWHRDTSFPVIGDFDNGGVLRPGGQSYPDFIQSLASFSGFSLDQPEGQRVLQGPGLGVVHKPHLHLLLRLFDDPDLPGGHRHSDIASLVLWWHGPVFVDPGVYLYTGPEAMRTEFRSETWHNMPVVANKNMHLVDPEKPFTLGRRTRNQYQVFEDGFTSQHSLYGREISRKIVLRENEILIWDQYHGHEPWVSGFTLWPGLQPIITPWGIELADQERSFRITVRNALANRVSQAFYCPAYGFKHKTSRVVIFPKGHEIEIAVKLT